MTYWFLYNLIDGSIYGSPYLGIANEWTNIPVGCGVLGPFDEITAPNEVKQAFLDPLSYKIINNAFVYSQYIPPPLPTPAPTTEELLSGLQNNFDIMYAQMLMLQGVTVSV